MAVSFYMDQNVPGPITSGLRLRDVDVLTAFDDGASRMPDPQLLERATELSRVLFTQDEDLLAEANKRQREGIPFVGVIYIHARRVDIGRCIDDLEIIAKAAEPADMANLVTYLPL